MKSTEAKKQFEKSLDQLAYSNSLWTVFQDFLDFSLLMLKWWDVKSAEFAELEKKYPEKKQQELFAEAYLATADMADNDGEGFKDVFGDYFMEHFSNDRRGQFFTPEPICDMNAVMLLGSEVPNGATIADPACGSGRFMLAAAKINRRMIFYASDIDITCCKMTVINYMMNSMEGEVAWMDTLSMDHWRSWHIRLVMNEGGFYMPYYYLTGAGETQFIQRLKNAFSDDEQEEEQEVKGAEEIKANKKGQILLFT